MKNETEELESFNNHKRWEIRYIAFLKFAKYKALKHKEIASLLERTVSSIGLMSVNIRQFEDNRHDPTNKLFDRVQKALQLEAQVRSGDFPDHLQYWLDRISRKNGIEYKTPNVEKPEEVSEEKAEEIPIPSTPPTKALEEEVKELVAATPVVEIKINLNSEQLGQILKLLLGGV